MSDGNMSDGNCFNPGFNPGMDCNVSYEFNPNWPCGKFIQIINAEGAYGGVIALDDLGNVWRFYSNDIGWKQLNPIRVLYVEEEENDQG